MSEEKKKKKQIATDLSFNQVEKKGKFFFVSLFLVFNRCGIFFFSCCLKKTREGGGGLNKDGEGEGGGRKTT